MEAKTSFGFNHPSILNEITKSCERLIEETQCDLEIFRNEQQELQQQIHQILEENSRFNSKLEVVQTKTSAAESRDDATREKLTNEALKNVKTQIDYLQTENKDLRSLNENLKKTIQNLEKEIQNYRNQLFNPTSACEFKQKYTTAIKLLESTIVSQKSELKEQSQIIENLFEQKRHSKGLIEHLEKTIEEKDKELSKCQETTEIIRKLQEQLKESLQHNKELQKSLKITKNSVEERFKREQSALQKVQEALVIAEAAVADKEEALKREKVVKEECDNIASTIGQVMDEAARKVERDMEAIRKKYMDKEKAMSEEKTKMGEEILNQNKLNQILNTRCNRFEQKFKDALKDNDKLTQQLELVVKTIHEMEKKLNQQEACNKSNRQLGKQSDEQEMEIKRYVQTNKQLQERYRSTLSDLTKSFEQHIYILHTEVANLKAENSLLKSRKSCGGVEG